MLDGRKDGCGEHKESQNLILAEGSPPPLLTVSRPWKGGSSHPLPGLPLSCRCQQAGRLTPKLWGLCRGDPQLAQGRGSAGLRGPWTYFPLLRNQVLRPVSDTIELRFGGLCPSARWPLARPSTFLSLSSSTLKMEVVMAPISDDACQALARMTQSCRYSFVPVHLREPQTDQSLLTQSASVIRYKVEENTALILPRSMTLRQLNDPRNLCIWAFRGVG